MNLDHSQTLRTASDETPLEIGQLLMMSHARAAHLTERLAFLEKKLQPVLTMPLPVSLDDSEQEVPESPFGKSLKALNDCLEQTNCRLRNLEFRIVL
jgi:hypothetical protein